MKKKSFIVIVILLIVIILGLCVFIAYDKNLFGIKGENKEFSNTVEKKEDTNTTKEVDINSELVKSLVYPNGNPDFANHPRGFILDDVNISDYSRDEKMIMAQAYDLYLNNKNVYIDENNMYICTFEKTSPIKITGVVRKRDGNISQYNNDNEIDCMRVSADNIKDSYKTIFGVDAEYQNANVSLNGCGFLNYYNDADNSYYTIVNCGGAYDYVDSVRKTYKAELKGDYLYVYDYAVIYHDIPAINSLLAFDSYEEFKNYESVENGDSSKYSVNNQTEITSKLEELINSGKANTYIWTFKKQSDGKYYYYSSKWQ